MRAAQRTQRETMTDDKTTEPSSTEPSPSSSSTDPSPSPSSTDSAEDIDYRFSRITDPYSRIEDPNDWGTSPE